MNLARIIGPAELRHWQTLPAEPHIDSKEERADLSLHRLATLLEWRRRWRRRLRVLAAVTAPVVMALLVRQATRTALA